VARILHMARHGLPWLQTAALLNIKTHPAQMNPTSDFSSRQLDCISLAFASTAAVWAGVPFT